MTDQEAFEKWALKYGFYRVEKRRKNGKATPEFCENARMGFQAALAHRDAEIKELVAALECFLLATDCWKATPAFHDARINAREILAKHKGAKP